MPDTRSARELEDYRQSSKAAANLAVVAAFTMTADDTVVECTANSGTGNYNITLPQVALAMGKMYSIHVITIANGNYATVVDAGDAAFNISLALNTTGDRAVFFSNGRDWFYFAVLT